MIVRDKKALVSFALGIMIVEAAIVFAFWFVYGNAPNQDQRLGLVLASLFVGLPVSCGFAAWLYTEVLADF